MFRSDMAPHNAAPHCTATHKINTLSKTSMGIELLCIYKYIYYDPQINGKRFTKIEQILK